MSYSLDFRIRVFELKDQRDLTYKETSELFNVPISTLFRWNERIEPYFTRNKPASKIDMDKLEKDVRERPDDYQWERAKRFGVSQSAIKYALDRLGVTYKKNSSSPESRRRGTYFIQK